MWVWCIPTKIGFMKQSTRQIDVWDMLDYRMQVSIILLQTAVDQPRDCLLHCVEQYIPDHWQQISGNAGVFHWLYLVVGTCLTQNEETKLSLQPRMTPVSAKTTEQPDLLVQYYHDTLEQQNMATFFTLWYRLYACYVKKSKYVLVQRRGGGVVINGGNNYTTQRLLIILKITTDYIGNT